MQHLKKIDILSAAKICGLISGSIYLVGSLAVIIFGSLFVSQESLNRFDVLGFGSTLFATILFALLVGAVNFIIGALAASVYNLAAKLSGGLKVELEPFVAKPAGRLFEKKEQPEHLAASPKFDNQGEEKIDHSDKPQKDVDEIISTSGLDK